MNDIPVFSQERDAGLASRIRHTNAVALASVPEITIPFPIAERVKGRFQSAVANAGHLDLHYLKTVLVTTGWNKNDDVFDCQETWAARRSPEDKPFNYEHNCADIIGHITSNYVIDDDSNLIAEDTLTDKLPAKFHVITAAVLYKFWDKADLQERMDKIIPEIIRGDWFVSMECLFSNFDYALRASNGTQKFVHRNEETAFLTKHLRAYGGDGKYQNWIVGRLLRGIMFLGKGLVRRPANPASVILTA